MIQILVTKKLADLLPAKVGKKSDEVPALDRWCVNLITINRRKVIVAMCADNRFGFVLWGVKKPDLSKLPHLIELGIRETLASYGVRADIIDDYANVEPVLYTGMSRSDIGPLNRMAIDLSNMRFREQPAELLPLYIAHTINDIPVNSGSKNVYWPYERMFESLANRYGVNAICIPAFKIVATLDLERYTASRTLMVPASFSFYQLHLVLQAAFGWQNSHMYEFTVDGQRLVCTEEELEDGSLLAKDVRLDSLVNAGTSVHYLYDFGDSWEIDLKTVSKQTDYDTFFPKCLECEGAAPPEDSGGVYGYLDFLDAYNDPKNPGYKDAHEWIGYRWTPLLSIRVINGNLMMLG